MIEEIILPALGETMDEGKIVSWLVGEGETVTKGTPIFEIETDKATIEVEATRDGLLRSIVIPPGESATIGTVVGYIADSMDVPLPDSKTGVLRSSSSQVKSEPIGGDQREGDPQDRKKRLIASPRARRLADETGVDISLIEHGSGPKGRIVEADVQAFVDRQTKIATAQPSSAAVMETRVDPVHRVVPLEGPRKAIAERMSQSAKNAPHFTLTSIVDMAQVESSRDVINNRGLSSDREMISTTAFILAASAWALRRNPWINAVLHDGEIHLLAEIHIGVAVARKEGLIVPVIRDVNQKNLSQIAEELHDITTRARGGSLKPEQASGSTFTISNLGMFGVEQFTAIINPPESAILAVGQIRRTVVPLEDDSVEIRPLMHMTLSCDHRVIDGAVGAHFLKDLSEALETPALLLT